MEKNELIVSEEKDMYSNELYATDLNYILNKEIIDSIDIKAKIRYGSKEADAKLYRVNNNTVKVVFETPQRAITKGQSVVFYIDDMVLGGGKII